MEKRSFNTMQKNTKQTVYILGKDFFYEMKAELQVVAQVRVCQSKTIDKSHFGWEETIYAKLES